MREKILTAIDLGSHAIRVVQAVVESGEKGRPEISVIGAAAVPSAGMRRGQIIDLEETVDALTTALENAERMSGEPIREAFVSIGGAHLGAHDGKGVVAIPRGGEVSEDDVFRVLEASENIVLPPNEEILKTIPREFAVDEQRGVKDPIGMAGIRLEAETLMLTGSHQTLRHFEKVVAETGVKILDFVPTPLAVPAAVLDKRQKEIGVATLDIGASSSTLSVFEEGNLLHLAILPLGGESLTNDLAIGCRCALETAEKLKLEYGHAVPDAIKKTEKISLGELSDLDAHDVERHLVAQILEARLHEIFMMARDELRAVGRDQLLPAGVAISGGTAKLPGILDLARSALGLPAQVGFPRVTGALESTEDPGFVTAFGAMTIGATEGGSRSGGGFSLPALPSFDFSKLRIALRNLLP